VAHRGFPFPSAIDYIAGPRVEVGVRRFTSRNLLLALDIARRTGQTSAGARSSITCPAVQRHHRKSARTPQDRRQAWAQHSDDVSR
jgi:hypothetical protein